MRKMLVALALSASLLLGGLAPSRVQAGRGGGSTGRSISSSGRSYSSGSRGGSSLSGKSYSSGSRSNPSKPSAPAATAPRGKNYASGPARNPATPAVPAPPHSGRSTAGSPSSNGKPGAPGSSQKPSGGTFDAGAAAAKNRAASKESYSGRSTASSAPSRKPPTDAPSTNGKPSPSARSVRPGAVSGKSYASGGPGTGSTADKQPASGSFDTNAAAVQRREESRAAFVQGQRPRSSWTDSHDETHPIDANDRQVENLRRQLDYERWANREMRQRQFYGEYYWRPVPGPVVVYHDPYSNVFWGWLLAQSLDQRASWAYHHRDSMDEARYRDLLTHDAQLEARIRQLEAQQLPRDPSYVPEGMSDPDLMYRDEYVTAVYNPHPRPSHALRVLLRVFLVMGLIALAIWLVFFKRWGGSDPPAAQGKGA